MAGRPPRLQRLLLALSASAALAACAEEPPAQVWTPADHQEPDAPTEDGVPGAEGVTPQGAGSGGPGREGASGEGGPPSADAIARAAASLFNVTCAGCHGADGRGNGPQLPPGIAVPDLSQPSVQDRTDAELAQVVREGRGAMPGFGQNLNDRGIAALVGHVRTLRQP